MMMERKNNRSSEPIYVTRSSMPSLEDYIEEIRPIFESRMLTNMGPVHQRFQEQLLQYLEVPQIQLFANGHLALENAIQGLGLQEDGDRLGGGEVITTPYTFVSTSHAIARNNLTPVFCDIRREDYCIDPDQIESLITERTVGIVPVHVYGNICDVEKIDRIAKKYNLKVIYDGAHSFGEKLNGVGVGNFGDATMYSFHATKVFNTVEGGAVTFKDPKYAEIFGDLINFGIHSQECIRAIGGNAKMDEFRAAMGICNLRRMEACIAARKAVHDRYFENLGNIEGIRLTPVQDGVESNYAYLPVYFDRNAFGASRDDVFNALAQEKIFPRKYFYPAVNDLECYSACNGNTPVAHDVSLNILTRPLYEELALQDVDRICRIILEAREKKLLVPAAMARTA